MSEIPLIFTVFLQKMREQKDTCGIFEKKNLQEKKKVNSFQYFLDNLDFF
jgi:hypothetical protein